MTVQTSTGVTFALVADTTGNPDAAGYDALTFVAVGEVTDVPEYGASATVVEHIPLATGIIEKHKGSINYGSTTIAMGRDSTDAGQVLLKAGNDGAEKNTQHSFRIGFADGTFHYFRGKIFSYTTNPGGNNNIVGSNVLIEIDTVILEVPAP